MDDNVILHKHLQASVLSGQIGKLFRSRSLVAPSPQSKSEPVRSAAEIEQYAVVDKPDQEKRLFPVEMESSGESARHSQDDEETRSSPSVWGAIVLFTLAYAFAYAFVLWNNPGLREHWGWTLVGFVVMAGIMSKDSDFSDWTRL